MSGSDIDGLRSAIKDLSEKIESLRREVAVLRKEEENNSHMIASLVSAVEQLGIGARPYQPSGNNESDSAYR